MWLTSVLVLTLSYSSLASGKISDVALRQSDRGGRGERGSSPALEHHRGRPEPQSTRGGKAQPEGRTIGVIADFFLSAHCLLTDCEKSSKRAEYCCSRSLNPDCCSRSSNSIYDYYHQHQHYHNPGYPAIPGSYPGSYPPYQQQYPQYPQYPPGSPQLPPKYPSAPYPGYNPYNPISPVSPTYPQGIQKPGSCPRNSRSDWQSDYHHQSTYSSKTSSVAGNYIRSCSYDFECPNQEKCCHTELHRGIFTMNCQYPIRSSYYY
ncbi:hypothetical protein TCAL_06496 [Tigriopus californicus]|uniref:WAP domain-containing protein n=1 Tax=Tigriopus californicus TaxID=6832 RepID=A0A553PTM8_TIGCA|nr:uncharacterized protein LOC131891268 [Tigriopus californicus]TRY81043.1 hypothetical protein TCAL_06496 [Tigriopus californicus]|eukprot:TCALIF_06496-PA protein Name:"Protein of unknown function" AED:0.29 eAED:0.29 QI:71/1/1/1/0.66/0.5/4/110/261